MSMGSAQVMASEKVSDAYAPGDSDSKWVLGGYGVSLNNPLADEDSAEGFIITAGLVEKPGW